jgi:hypothetical protein
MNNIFKHKKGVEMSVNTMIIIVLGLLVLIIIAFLLMGGAKNFTDANKCQNKGGNCEKTQCDPGEISGVWSCENKNPCCTPIGSK